MMMIWFVLKWIVGDSGVICWIELLLKYLICLLSMSGIVGNMNGMVDDVSRCDVDRLMSCVVCCVCCYVWIGWVVW